MIRAKICFAAVAVVQDTTTNSVSAFNILEGVTAVGMPFFMQSLAFFVLWEREANDPPRALGTLTININEQQLIAQGGITVDFGAGLRHRTVVNVNGLIVPRPGLLRFRLELEAGVRAEYVVDVATPAPGVQVQPQGQ